MKLCPNLKHNLSWKVSGLVDPCNHLTDFPQFQTVEQLYQSKEYLQLVDDQVNGKYPTACQRCWDKESIGLPSKRESDTRLDNVYSKLNTNYIKIDAAIGDICNAACRICDSTSSTTWQQLDKKFFGTTIKKHTQLDLWQYINGNLDKLLQLDFGGGEPWLNNINDQINVFEKLIESGRSKLIKLRYNTNGSIQPQTLLEKFQYFREVEVTLSLDDIGNRFEYNRYPLKWDKVLSTIQYLRRLSNAHLTINYSVSVFTWWYVQEFKSWAIDNGLDYINWNIVTTPWVYSIKSLPNTIKETVDPTHQFYELISKNPRNNWLTEFWKLTHLLDQQRGQDFNQTFPELAKHYN
jgi:hypothetical protein